MLLRRIVSVTVLEHPVPPAPEYAITPTESESLTAPAEKE